MPSLIFYAFVAYQMVQGIEVHFFKKYLTFLDLHSQSELIRSMVIKDIILVVEKLFGLKLLFIYYAINLNRTPIKTSKNFQKNLNSSMDLNYASIQKLQIQVKMNKLFFNLQGEDKLNVIPS